MKALIQKLTETYGPSGFEDAVRALIRAEIEPLVDEITVDAMGNLIALKKGDGTGSRVMIATHMDEIGVMVSHITENGFLRFTNIGGVSNIDLNGKRVLFGNGTIGIIGSERRNDRSRVGGLDKYYIDVGATSCDDVPVQVGDAAGFWSSYVERGSLLTAKSMDDRVACAIAIATLRQLESSPHDVYFAFTVQEEVGVRGATVVANRVQPDVGIALDVTLSGDTPNCMPIAVELGKGPAIKVKDSGMIAHPGLVKVMKAAAVSAEIPYQLEVLVAGSTDARAMQISGIGTAAGCISIPCRYIHSASETVALSDVEQSVTLLHHILTNPINL
ncbi:MAG: M42 family metallopeptidase [Candidatus Promineifilaceae bacterium]